MTNRGAGKLVGPPITEPYAALVALMGMPTGEDPAFATAVAQQFIPTLRDYFAIQALNGLLSDPNVNGSAANLADLAYEYADHMMTARKAVARG